MRIPMLSLPQVLIIGFVLFLSSCSKKGSNDRLLAEVGGEELYLSDIFIPSGLSSDDSSALVNLMIDNWVRQQLMYMDAEENLDADEKDLLEKKAENSRKLIYASAMEEKLLDDSLKLRVSNDDLMKYYTENPDEFLLSEHIVQVQYLKLSIKNPETAQMKQLLNSNKDSDQRILREKAKKTALNYFLEENVWLYFNDILKEIPIKTDQQEDFLRNTNYYEAKTDSVVYLVRFRGYMLASSTAPFALVKERIGSILDAKKKHQVLEEYRNKLYENALKENRIKLYTD